MPRHRLAFFFRDELITDRASWHAWIEAATPRLRTTVTLGERRPFVEVAAPFAHRDPITTPRADEVDGLELVESLLDQLVVLCRATARPIALLLSGQPFGGVGPDGRDPVVSAHLDEWKRLLASRPPDEPSWEREGCVSIWAGTVSRKELDRLLAERYGTDAPISMLARSLGIHFYDHDLLETMHLESAVPAGAAIARLSFADSFVERIPELCAPRTSTPS